MIKKVTCKKLMPKLLSYLKRCHTGAEKAINSRYLESRFRVCGATVRRTVQLLRCDGHPICSDMTGYYYAGSTPELRDTIQRFEGRIYCASKIRKALNCALCRMPDTGQTCLERR